LRDLILGSAQFGKGYGTYIKSPEISKSNLAGILNLANSYGIDLIDTSLNYSGVTKKLASQNLSKKFKIGTKIEFKSNNQLLILKKLKNNLTRFNLGFYESILIHNWATLSEQERINGINFLYKLRDLGFSKKIGLSVYDTKELSRLSKKIDIIQAPLNYFNLLFLNDKKVFAMKEHGTEFHARSIFHQGTLINHSNLPHHFKKEILKFKMFSKQFKLSYLQGALSIFDSQEIFSKLVVGINTREELFEIINCPVSNSKVNLSSIEASTSTKFKDPRTWRKNL